MSRGATVLLPLHTREARLRRALLAGIVALAALHGLVLAYHLGLTLAFPYDLNYGEGYVLNDALRLSRGQPMYVDLQQFPMVRSPYPPLFPWLWSALIGLTGPVFWAGRAISVAALAALLGVVACHARKTRAGVWPVVVAPALVAASPFVYQWAGFARVDMLALVLAASGVCVAQWVSGWRGVLLSAALCTLALWTKQTAVTAAVAVALALLLRRRSHGLAFVALVALPSLAVAWVLDAGSGGEFARHVVEGNASNPLSAARAAIYIGYFVALHLPALLAGLWWLSRSLHRGSSPVTIYLVIALLAAFSVGSGGSSVNYLIEPVVALALTLPFAWRAAGSTSQLAAPLLAVVQLLVLVHVPNGFGTDYLALAHTPTAEDVATGAQVDAVVRAEPGEIIAEPAGFALRNGKQVQVQPIDLRAEELHGRWQSGPLVEALSIGRFRVVIVEWDYLPADADRAVVEHYRLESSLPGPDSLPIRIYRYVG